MTQYTPDAPKAWPLVSVEELRGKMHRAVKHAVNNFFDDNDNYNEAHAKIDLAFDDLLINKPELHEDTRKLVMEFAVALADKLAEAEKKYGYSNGWKNTDWLDECRIKLLEHTAKGDPRDVAAYCAFLWYHNSHTAGSNTALSHQAAEIEGLNDEINCAEEELDSLSASLGDALEQTEFNCIGEYIRAVFKGVATKHDVEMERLKAELAECREDAERWRYCERTLRFPHVEPPAFTSEESRWVVKNNYLIIGIGQSPSEAIDQARKETS